MLTEDAGSSHTVGSLCFILFYIEPVVYNLGVLDEILDTTLKRIQKGLNFI